MIVFSGSSAQSDVRAAYDAHANCYIVKPMDFDQFLSVALAVNKFWLSNDHFNTLIS